MAAEERRENLESGDGKAEVTLQRVCGGNPAAAGRTGSSSRAASSWRRGGKIVADFQAKGEGGALEPAARGVERLDLVTAGCGVVRWAGSAAAGVRREAWRWLRGRRRGGKVVARRLGRALQD